STWQDPVKTDYRGTTIYETSPNSQAATVLLWLNMLEEYDLKRYSASYPTVLEIMLETCIRAYEQRAKHIGDFELPDKFTTKQFAKDILEHRTKRTKRPNAKRDSGDTTYFCVGRQNGDSVSVIQSNYMGFGSGLVPEGTGFVLHNRGSYFSLDENHHNSIRPGKRTFHTLCASLGESSQKTSFTIGSMGGDIQPQVHVQLMTKILDFGMDPQVAIDSPRWIIPFTIYEKPSIVYFEPESKIQSSKAKKIVRKLKLSFKEFDSFSSSTGHAQAILFKNDYLSGGADPRGDGAVVGF
ncbi:MAG: gamma-glutamyltransferase, partial [Nitrososphaerota archaeon]|nr:gamma-glutamyltransferase [Nitrososphaerota archaeon]